VVWNSRARVIGSSADHARGGAVFDLENRPVNPKSLYLKQLEQRLGPCAVDAVRAD
jgi:hypothetical protein